MKVAETPDFLQSVIDDPRVFRWIAEDNVESAPLAQIFEHGIGLEFDGGGFFFHRLGDGVYEVHTLFLPGEHNAFACCKAAAHYLFCATECMEIVTKVPEDNIPAWKLTEKMGFRLDYVQPAHFRRGGKFHDVRHYSLSMADWMRSQPSPEWVYNQCHALDNGAKGVRARYRWAVMNNDFSIMGDSPCQ